VCLNEGTIASWPCGTYSIVTLLAFRSFSHGTDHRSTWLPNTPALGLLRKGCGAFCVPGTAVSLANSKSITSWPSGTYSSITLVAFHRFSHGRTSVVPGFYFNRVWGPITSFTSAHNPQLTSGATLLTEPEGSPNPAPAPSFLLRRPPVVTAVPTPVPAPLSNTTPVASTAPTTSVDLAEQLGRGEVSSGSIFKDYNSLSFLIPLDIHCRILMHG
jgi:hypothetical protein